MTADAGTGRVSGTGTPHAGRPSASNGSTWARAWRFGSHSGSPAVSGAGGGRARERALTRARAARSQPWAGKTAHTCLEESVVYHPTDCDSRRAISSPKPPAPTGRSPASTGTECRSASHTSSR